MEQYLIYLRKSRSDLEAEAHGEGETLSRPSYAGKLRKMPPTTCEIP
jgi:hypothetical protein